MNGHPPKRSERGAVLLTTLLVMAIIAALAVQIMDNMLYGVRRTHNIQSQAQSVWMMKGADLYIQRSLQSILGTNSPEALNRAILEAEPTELVFDKALITLEIADGSNCFPLGALVSPDGRSNEFQTEKFTDIMTAIGLDRLTASRVSGEASDWQDLDVLPLPQGAEDSAYAGLDRPYRTTNTVMSSVMEMRALRSVTPKIYDAIQPYICASSAGRLPAVNINTLEPRQWPLLRAVFNETFSDSELLGLITARPAAGYADGAGFWAMPLFEGRDLGGVQADFLVFTPRSLWIETRIEQPEFTRYMAAHYRLLNEGRMERLFVRNTREPFRVWPDTEDDTP